MSAATARHARRPAPICWTPRARRLGTALAEGAAVLVATATIGAAAIVLAPTSTVEPMPQVDTTFVAL